MHVYFGASISQAFWRLAYPSNRRPYAAENAIIQNAQCANSASDLASKEMPFWFGRCKRHVDGSGSPMETVDEMLLCLPYRLGGYGLDIPEMNHEEPLSPMAASLAGRETVRFDLYWPDLGFAVEHQGEYDHNKKERYYDDRARIAGTRIAGYDLIELTGGICGKLNSIEQVALYIAKRQGKRIPKNALGETKQRAELRNGLFEWNRKWAPKNESQT